ncbi:UNVERIFIED_CONTAM: hypothetical protein Sradi_1499100 [Sesamum radiatum]|uniref:Uncharacterized protein n=1 Tax=Sesamum radiatum TaxID=300843 RepID=A0AAW2U714_SESRA
MEKVEFLLHFLLSAKVWKVLGGMMIVRGDDEKVVEGNNKRGVDGDNYLRKRGDGGRAKEYGGHGGGGMVMVLFIAPWRGGMVGGLEVGSVR